MIVCQHVQSLYSKEIFMTHLQQFDGLKLPDSIRYLDAVDNLISKIRANEMKTSTLELVSLLHRLKVSIFC